MSLLGNKKRLFYMMKCILLSLATGYNSGINDNSF